MPRSPSRDRSDRHRGSRGYFRRPDAVTRGKWLLSAAALAAVVGWVVVEVARPAAAESAHTHGTLAHPHAAWDADCAACHVPSAAGDFLKSPLGVADPAGRWRAFTCEKCHAGPAHAAATTPEDAAFHAQCANCHHDHGGRDNSLVRLTDSHCVRCHADPAAHAIRNPTPITDFATHPDFAPLKTPPDARALKFSHALHMAPGVAYSPGGREELTADRAVSLFGEAALRYVKPGEPGDKLVQLDCVSCHQLDAGAGTAESAALTTLLTAGGQPAKSILPPRAAGATFLPVNFDASCRTCHPLAANPGAAAGQLVEPFDLPHRVDRAKLEGELLTGYLKSLLRPDRPELDAPAGPSLGRTRPPADATPTLREAATALAGKQADRLFRDADAGCLKCHDLGGDAVRPVPDRTVWLPKARFDHTSHRSTACAECHPGTYAPVPATGKVTEKEPVQIEGVASCRVCHAPGGTAATLADGTTVPAGGARHGCTDCHSYHNGTHPLQGRGAAARNPAAPLPLTDYFRGGR